MPAVLKAILTPITYKNHAGEGSEVCIELVNEHGRFPFARRDTEQEAEDLVNKLAARQGSAIEIEWDRNH